MARAWRGTPRAARIAAPRGRARAAIAGRTGSPGQVDESGGRGEGSLGTRGLGPQRSQGDLGAPSSLRGSEQGRARSRGRCKPLTRISLRNHPSPPCAVLRRRGAASCNRADLAGLFSKTTWSNLPEWNPLCVRPGASRSCFPAAPNLHGSPSQSTGSVPCGSRFRALRHEGVSPADVRGPFLRGRPRPRHPNAGAERVSGPREPRSRRERAGRFAALRSAI